MESKSWECISFDGSDSLCLAKFAQHLGEEECKVCLEHCIVHVQGKTVGDELSINTVGELVNGVIDGYVRNIRLRLIKEQKPQTEWRVGCEGATLEDVSAVKVSFLFYGISSEFAHMIQNSHFAYYADSRGETNIEAITDRFLNQLHECDSLRTIAVAKRFRNELSAEKLILLLKDTSLDKTTLEMAIDAFRSLENLCNTSVANSTDATNALMSYISENCSKSKLPNATEENRSEIEHPNSVIYAIEALGFVTNREGQPNVTVWTFLSELLSDSTLDWHVVWASLVVLIRIGPQKELDILTILDVLYRLINEKKPAQIGPDGTKDVILNLILEVICLHEKSFPGRKDILERVLSNLGFDDASRNRIKGVFPDRQTHKTSLEERLAKLLGILKPDFIDARKKIIVGFIVKLWEGIF